VCSQLGFVEYRKVPVLYCRITSDLPFEAVSNLESFGRQLCVASWALLVMIDLFFWGVHVCDL
jgi:hypothetical protein